eukprot:3298331-Prymnesium_polylepis.1
MDNVAGRLPGKRPGKFAKNTPTSKGKRPVTPPNEAGTTWYRVWPMAYDASGGGIGRMDIVAYGLWCA